MTGTIYSIHRAYDKAILAIACPGNLNDVAARVARALRTEPQSRAREVFVHNGKGVVAAGTCNAGAWLKMDRAPFMGFDADARAKRAEEGFPNDPKGGEA